MPPQNRRNGPGHINTYIYIHNTRPHDHAHLVLMINKISTICFRAFINNSIEMPFICVIIVVVVALV